MKHLPENLLAARGAAAHFGRQAPTLSTFLARRRLRVAYPSDTTHWFGRRPRFKLLVLYSLGSAFAQGAGTRSRNHALVRCLVSCLPLLSTLDHLIPPRQHQNTTNSISCPTSTISKMCVCVCRSLIPKYSILDHYRRTYGQIRDNY